MGKQRQQSVTGPNKPDKPQSLAVFMQEKARAGCLICKLPSEIQAQLGRPATKKGFTREDQVEWLRTIPAAAGVTLEILIAHLNAKHFKEVAHGTA